MYTTKKNVKMTILTTILVTACNAQDLQGTTETVAPPSTVTTSPASQINTQPTVIYSGSGQTETCVPASLNLSCDFTLSSQPTHAWVWDTVDFTQPEAQYALGYVVSCQIGSTPATQVIASLKAYYSDQVKNPMLSSLPQGEVVTTWGAANCADGIEQDCTASTTEIVMFFPTLQSSPTQMCAQ